MTLMASSEDRKTSLAFCHLSIASKLMYLLETPISSLIAAL